MGESSVNRTRVTVVLSTRDRAGVIRRAIRTILANDHPDFEVVIIDQSDDRLTETSLDGLLSDPRVRYLRSATRGRSAGLNAGIREARGELVLLTDDDCSVPQNWIQRFEEAFAADDKIGIVFGNVLPAPQDHDTGCIPAYIRQGPFLARGIRDKHLAEGVGACMAVRHRVWQSLGGFDEMLGAGSRFLAGEDGDLVIRALFAGHWIYETPAVSVTHYGHRSWEQLPALIHNYWLGTGAMMVKSFKIAPWRILPLLLRLAGKWAMGRSSVGASLGPRQRRLTKLWSFGTGFVAGATLLVERGTGLYVRHENRTEPGPKPAPQVIA